MKQSKSSKQWLTEHFNDPYVKQSKQDGFRSRAAYKLIELQQKYRFIRAGDTVVDLGAAPGGWSQVVRDWLGEQGILFALDRLPIEPMAGVQFIQGDFTEASVLQELERRMLQHAPPCTAINAVLSDMAPNLSGIKAADQAKSIYLAELALDFALTHLVANSSGWFVVKFFHGVGSEDYIASLRKAFKQVSLTKPAASRARSSEIYAVARDKKV